MILLFLSYVVFSFLLLFSLTAYALWTRVTGRDPAERLLIMELEDLDGLEDAYWRERPDPQERKLVQLAEMESWYALEPKDEK